MTGLVAASVVLSFSFFLFFWVFYYFPFDNGKLMLVLLLFSASQKVDASSQVRVSACHANCIIILFLIVTYLSDGVCI